MNEVKRDNETLRQITNFQLSIENLVRGGVKGPMGRVLIFFWGPVVKLHCTYCAGPVSGQLWPA